MVAWIAGLIAHTAGGINDLAADVVRKFLALWNTITGFFGKVRSFLKTMRAWLMSWLSSVHRWVESAYNTAKWIITTWVPHFVADAITKLRRVLLIAIDLARTYARQLVATLQQWARLALGRLTQWVADLRSWILARVADLVVAIARLNRYAFTVLGTASRIVAYILAPLVSALGRWFLANVEALTRRAYRILPRLVMFSANLIEGIVTRML
jgi:hypothetical protein